MVTTRERYELITDENGEEKRTRYREHSAAIVAWQRAVRRKTCFSARLVDIDGNLLGDYQSE